MWFWEGPHTALMVFVCWIPGNLSGPPFSSRLYLMQKECLWHLERKKKWKFGYLMKLISMFYNTKQIILRTSPFPSEGGSCGLWQQQWLKQKIKPCEHFVQDFSTRYLRLTNVSSCWEVLICLHYFKHNWLKPELLSLGQHSWEVFRTRVFPQMI